MGDYRGKGGATGGAGRVYKHSFSCQHMAVSIYDWEGNLQLITAGPKGVQVTVYESSKESGPLPGVVQDDARTGHSSRQVTIQEVIDRAREEELQREEIAEATFPRKPKKATKSSKGVKKRNATKTRK